LGACIIFAVLALGAVDAWSLFSLQCAAVFLFLVWTALSIQTKRITLEFIPLLLPLLALIGIGGLQVLLPTSAYTSATIGEMLLYLTYGLYFFLALQTLSDEQNLSVWSTIMTLFGFALAVFAIVQDFTAEGRIYWVIKPRAGWMFGPYVHHGHYAGMMEMLIPFPLVKALTAHNVGKCLLYGFFALTMLASVFLSQSRAGMFSVLVELAFVMLLVLKQKSQRRRRLISTVTIAALALLLLASLGSEDVWNRVVTIGHAQTWQKESTLGRIAVLKDSFPMVRQRPLLGWGLGTFATVYPGYRTFYINMLVNAAHDDYLQLLVEAGVLGFTAILVFVVLLYYYGLQKIRRWQHRPAGGYAMAALAGCTGLLTHSFVDFNLHIPANGIMFFCLAAASCALPQTSNGDRFTIHTTRGHRTIVRIHD